MAILHVEKLKTELVKALAAVVPFFFLKRWLPDKFAIYGHLISDNKKHAVSHFYRYPTLDEFGNFINEYRNLGYTFVGLDEYLNNNIQKKILLSFDDGFKSIYEELHPFMIANNLPYMIFILTDPLKDPGFFIKTIQSESPENNKGMFLSAQEVNFLKDQGVHIGFHTRSHMKIENSHQTNDSELVAQLTIPREYLNLFSQPLCFAYPYIAPGEYERFNMLMANNSGFEYFFDTKGFRCNNENHFFRVCIDVEKGVTSANAIRTIVKRQLISYILNRVKSIL